GRFPLAAGRGHGRRPDRRDRPLGPRGAECEAPHRLRPRSGPGDVAREPAGRGVEDGAALRRPALWPGGGRGRGAVLPRVRHPPRRPRARRGGAHQLHPNAHDEPPLYLPLFDTVFHLPHAFGFLTEEEGDLVRRRFQPRRRSTTLGIGVDLEATGNGDAFRATYGLGGDPYLVYVGRLDPHKGVDELYDFFVTYKRLNPGPLRLVCVGEPVKPMP